MEQPLVSTPRLVLRPVSASLAAAVVAGDLSGLDAGDGWPTEDTVDGLNMVVTDGAPAWLVTLGGRVIGDCGSHGPVDEAGAVELGFGLAAPYRGQGYGTEVARALAGALGAQPGVRRVVARGVLPDNVPSRRALERVGFTVERETADGVWYERSVDPGVLSRVARGRPSRPVRASRTAPPFRDPAEPLPRSVCKPAERFGVSAHRRQWRPAARPARGTGGERTP